MMPAMNIYLSGQTIDHAASNIRSPNKDKLIRFGEKFLGLDFG